MEAVVTAPSNVLTMAEEIGKQRQKAQVEKSSERLLGDKIIDMDQEARDTANEALAKHNAHELLCSERWNQSKDAMKRMEAGLAELKAQVESRANKLQDAMDDRIGKIPAAIIAALTGLVGFLAARAWPVH